MEDHRWRPAEVLPEEAVEPVVDEAIQVLGKIGILVESDEAIRLLQEAGAQIDGDKRRVFFDEPLVHRAIESAPASFELFDRDGDQVATIGRAEPLFNPGSAALYVHDHGSGEMRRAESGDVITFARLTESLPAYRAQSTCVVPGDVPEEFADRYRLYLALLHSKKPIITGTFALDGFRAMCTILEAVRGGAAALREKPLAIFDCCPSSPLMWSALTCDVLIDCARAGIPAEIVPVPVAGASAPVTVAGALVQHTAENLAGLVIHQLAAPGAPIVWGGAPACMDMRTATTPFAAPESLQFGAATAAVARRLNLPCHSYMGASDGKLVDYQAGLESLAGILNAHSNRIDVVAGAGMLDFLGSQSAEKLVLDAEAIELARRLTGGLAIGAAPHAIEVIGDSLESKSFLANDHTRENFRNALYYPSPAVDRSSLADWEKAGSTDAAERAYEMVRDILKRPATAAAPESLAGELTAIMKAEAAKFGIAELPSNHGSEE